MRVQRFATLDGHRRLAIRPSRSARSTRSRCGWGWSCTRASTTRRSSAQAEEEADVVIWDGGNNDFPFFAPDLLIVVADPLRPGHELLYHPGETNLRMADVVVINKVDSAEAHNVEQVLENVESPSTRWRRSSSRSRRRASSTGPTSSAGASSSSTTARPSRTARCRSVPGSSRPATRARPRSSTRGPYAVGSLKDVFAKWPQLTNVLPAMGYSRRAAARARADDQRGRLRRRRHRHADRPGAADPLDASDPPRALRARGGRHADARRRARADRHARRRPPIPRRS